MKKFGHQQKFLLTIFFILIAFLFANCSACSKDKKDLFSEKLKEIDTQSSINPEDAKNSLNALLAYASTPQEFLSIAKRQYYLKDLFSTVKTLDTGLAQFSDNAELSAFLTVALMESGRYEDARMSGAQLDFTRYTAIAAEAAMRADVHNSVKKTKPELWEAAYDATGIQTFLKNTAIMHATSGDLLKAYKLRGKIAPECAPKHPYFWTCVAFDLGFFDRVFDDLPHSLDKALHEKRQNPKAESYAQKHLLLAADAAYGSGDVERARAFWQDYIDRFDDIPPYIMYNMAKTASTTKEQVEQLLQCLDVHPDYYPVAAEYIRLMMADRKKAPQDALDTQLAGQKAFSLSMEEKLYATPDFVLSPEEVLQQAKDATARDPRFKLELFRYNEEIETDVVRNAAAMWRLLEKHPNDAYVREYARWFFAHNYDFDSALAVGDIADTDQQVFYAGVKASLNGQTERALAHFFEAQKYPYTRLAALVNSARIYSQLDDNPAAVESYLAASKTAYNPVERSYFEYEAARILAEHSAIDDAILHLHSAIDLNPDNYLAQQLLARLELSRN